MKIFQKHLKKFLSCGLHNFFPKFFSCFSLIIVKFVKICDKIVFSQKKLNCHRKNFFTNFCENSVRMSQKWNILHFFVRFHKFLWQISNSHRHNSFLCEKVRILSENQTWHVRLLIHFLKSNMSTFNISHKIWKWSRKISHRKSWALWEILTEKMQCHRNVTERHKRLVQFTETLWKSLWTFFLSQKLCEILWEMKFEKFENYKNEAPSLKFWPSFARMSPAMILVYLGDKVKILKKIFFKT